jgi:hypothetical protein
MIRSAIGLHIATLRELVIGRATSPARKWKGILELLGKLVGEPQDRAWPSRHINWGVWFAK